MCEHSLHGTGKAGTAWIIEGGLGKLLVKIVKRLQTVGSVFLRKTSLDGVSIRVQLAFEPLDFAKTVPELIKNRSAFVAISQIFHFRLESCRS